MTIILKLTVSVFIHSLKMPPNESGKKNQKLDNMTVEAEILMKYLSLKKVNKPTLKHLTAPNYGRPAEQHNPGLKLQLDIFFKNTVR